MKTMTKNLANGPRTAFSAVEAGDSCRSDRTILARIETAPTSSEAGKAGGVESRTPAQDGRSRKMQAPGKRFWRRTTPARVKTAEVA